MSFKMKYNIVSDYLPVPSSRRPGKKLDKVAFVVAHDTGNKNSTAKNNVTYYRNSCNREKASAHIFVDDKEIRECIPALTAAAEKAWHVIYNVTTDNRLYGDDANDAAIGVEYCYGSNIDADEAYRRYLWVLAYICYKFDLDPSKTIVGHMVLDPGRKTDPQNGLSASGRSYKQLLLDVVSEYHDCMREEKVMLEDWKNKMGSTAIDRLTKMGIISNPDEWKAKLEEPTQNWLFFELIKRVAEKK